MNGTALPLRTMAGDEIAAQPAISSPATRQPSRRAWMASKVEVQELPAPYAAAVENKVIWVAQNSSSVSPDQLDAAATDAEGLAGQISQLCLSSPS